jgi:NADPH:quinone reductase-like Zn-dependent oxidoreductase
VAALQLAAVSGAVAFGTVRTSHKIAAVEAIIAKLSLEPPPRVCTPDALDETIRGWRGGSGIDLILDPVGASYVQHDLSALAECGRIVYIGTMGGSNASVDIGTLLRKRLRLIGTVLRSRSLEEKAAVTSAFVHEVLPLIANGGIGPVIDRSFALDRATDAFRYMEENRNVGKIVLTMR